MATLKTMNEAQLSALTLLIGAYRWTMDDLAMAAWGHYLADIDAAVLRSVVDAWVLTETRPPSIADLRDRVAALNGTDAESAWQRVVRILASGGFRDRTKMGGPVLAPGFTGDPALEDAVRDAGGWSDLARSDEKALVWAKKDFVAAYAKQSGAHEALTALGMGAGALTDGRN